MDTSHDQILNARAIWARRIAVCAGASILTAWCIFLYLPKTIFERVASSVILLPLYLTDITTYSVQLSNIWQATVMRYSPVPMLISMAVFGILAWRCQAFDALITGNRNTRFLSGAFLAFGLMVLLDFFISLTARYPYGDQNQHLLLAGFAIAFGMKADRKWWQFLIGIILACVVLQSVYAICLYISGEDVFTSPSVGIARATGTLRDSNPSYIYPLCLMGSLLLLPLTTSEKRLPIRLAYWLAVAVLMGTLLLTFTRGAVIGLVLGLIWLAYEERQNKRFWIPVMLAFIIMASVFIIRATNKSGHLGVDRATLGRVQIWRISTKIIQDNWLLGVGYNEYLNAQKHYMDPKLARFNPINVEAKNQALTMMAFNGVLGAGVFVLFIYAVWTACKSGKKEDYTPWEWRMKQGIAAAGIGILAAGLVDTPIYSFDRFPGTFMWLCCMGFLLHLEVRNHPPAGEWRYRKAFRTALLSVLALGILGAGYVTILGAVDAHRASKVFDTKLAQVKSTPGFTPLKDIPKAMQDCIIADEDLYFYQHHGYSLVDMHRALRVNIRAGRVKQGGSTITQQLAKNLFFSHNRTIRRKIAEIIMAVKLEKKLSKKEILETYLNTIEYGLGSQGIGEAACTYFGKDASKLTDAECALLAGLIPSPPKQALTSERAKSAIHITLGRLKNANPSMWLSVKDELDQAGENAWLKNHIRSRKQE